MHVRRVCLVAKYFDLGDVEVDGLFTQDVNSLVDSAINHVKVRWSRRCDDDDVDLARLKDVLRVGRDLPAKLRPERRRTVNKRVANPG